MSDVAHTDRKIRQVRDELQTVRQDSTRTAIALATAVPTQSGQSGKVLGTNGTSTAWSTVGTIDTASIPQPASGAGNPGSGALGAAASDHVHPLTAGLLPLWQTIATGEITLPRIHSDTSDSYGSNPASGELRLTYFRAQQTGSRSTVRFQTGGSAAVTSTLARVGVYSVDEATGNLTALLASCANKTTFSGTYNGQTCALTTAASLTAGVMYAVGILQLATTPASMTGQWFNGTFMGATPKLARKLTGLSDLPAGPVTTGFADTQFPVYCELV